MRSADVSSLEHELRSLKRGLMSGNERATLEAYKALYKIGMPAAAAVALELERFDLKKPLQPETSALLAGLVSLQRDIDENSSDAFIDARLGDKPSPIAASILRSAQRMRSSEFGASRYGDIMILEHTAIDARYEASKHVQTWLSELPTEELIGVSRVCVVPADFKNDWLGRYMPILGVVTVAWSTVIPPISAFTRLMNAAHRHALIHEVGHHVYRHSFGQDPEHEEQAEAYVRSKRRRTMPIWARCARKLLALM